MEKTAITETDYLTAFEGNKTQYRRNTVLEIYLYLKKSIN